MLESSSEEQDLFKSMVLLHNRRISRKHPSPPPLFFSDRSADRLTLNMENPGGVTAQSIVLEFSHVSIKQEAEHSLKSRLVCERYFVSSSILFAEGSDVRQGIFLAVVDEGDGFEIW